MEVIQDYSPAMSNFSDMDDEALDLYLANCGRLSNLPTPPQPSHHLPAFNTPPTLQTPPPEPEISQIFDELRVYATHIAGLVPSIGLEKEKGDVVIIEGFLRRARLPVEVIAFSGCILQKLSEAQEMDSLELLVLSSLALAHGYLNDRGRSNSHWAVLEADGRFEAMDVQRAKMSILQDIDFGLFRIGEEEVDRMVTAMQRDLPAPLTVTAATDKAKIDEDDGRHKVPFWSGTPGQAIWTYGVQTPEPSP